MNEKLLTSGSAAYNREITVDYIVNLGHYSNKNHSDISSPGISKYCFSVTCFEKHIEECYIRVSCKGFYVHIFCQIVFDQKK